MSEVIGIGVLKTVVDSKEFKTGMAENVEAMKRFEDGAKKTGEQVQQSLGGAKAPVDQLSESTVRLDATTKRFLAALEREGEQAGRTRSEFLQLRAAKLGVTQQAEAYIQRIQQAERSTVNLGMSAKATAAAMRGVPAQFTDIVVSLQGGMNPMTVFLQQGGQLKDMFGGAGNAARALAAYIGTLITPFTVLAAAVATLGVAYYQGSKEQDAYNKQIILTGNYAGVTTNQLHSMAEGFRATGTTQSKAAETLAAVVGTGQVAKTELEAVARATMNLVKVGGEDMNGALQNFVRLGEDPVKASVKLNESYHYLTQTIYEQIKALDEAGRRDEAAALAQKTFANAINDRANEIKQSLGYIERAFEGTIAWAKKAWDAILGVGRPVTLDNKLAEVQQKIDQRINESWKFGGNPDTDPGLKKLREYQAALQEQQRLEKRSAEMQAQAARDNERAVRATDEVQKWQDRAKGVDAVTKKLEEYRKGLEDIRKVNPNSALLTPEAIAAGEAAIRKANQGRTTKEKPYRDDAGTKFMQQIREETAALQEQLDYDDKITKSRKELAKFEQLIIDLKEKGTLTADQKSLLANEEQIRILLKKKVLLEDEVKAKEASAKADEKARKEAEAAYGRFLNRIKNNELTMQSRQEDRGGQYQRSLEGYTMSARDREQGESQRRIYSEYAGYKLALDKQTPADKLGSSEYSDAVEQIRIGLQNALKAHEDYYTKLRALQNDSDVARDRSIQDFIDRTENAADTVGRIWTKGLEGAADAFVNFGSQGSKAFKDLIASILLDIARLEARRALAGALGVLTGGESSGGGKSIFGSFVNNLFGGIIGGVSSWFGGAASNAASSAVSNSLNHMELGLSMAGGGYTGPGGKFDYAGIVHRGEVVWSQDDVRNAGGVAVVEALRKGMGGYAGGGPVGIASPPAIPGRSVVVNAPIYLSPGTNADDFRKSRKQVEQSLAKSLKRANV